MRNELLDLWNEGFDDFTADLGEEFTLGGITYTGIINDADYAAPLFDDGGGRMAKLALSIVVSKLTLTSAPAIGALMIVRGKRAKVESVKEDEVSFELIAVTSDK